MTTEIRAWRIDDAPALAEILNNKKIHDNLEDGLPYPYTEKDAEEYISAMLSALRCATASACTFWIKRKNFFRVRSKNIATLTATITCAYRPTTKLSLRR